MQVFNTCVLNICIKGYAVDGYTFLLLGSARKLGVQFLHISTPLFSER